MTSDLRHLIPDLPLLTQVGLPGRCFAAVTASLLPSIHNSSSTLFPPLGDLCQHFSILAFSSPPPPLVQRTPHGDSRLIEHMRIDHRRRDILVAQQILNRADIVARLQQMRGERVAKRVTGGRF